MTHVANPELASLFKKRAGEPTTRVDWKRVTLRRNPSSNEKFVKTYLVIMDKETVIGEIGLLKKQHRIHRLRTWGWAKAGDTLDELEYHEHSYGKEWAVSDMLFTLSRPPFVWR